MHEALTFGVPAHSSAPFMDPKQDWLETLYWWFNYDSDHHHHHHHHDHHDHGDTFFFLERHAVAGQMQKSEDCDGRAASSLGLAQ